MSEGDSAAADELAKFLLPGLRIIIRRRVNPQDVEDVLQDTCAEIFAALKARRLRDAEALPGFARIIAVRKCAACINASVANRSRMSGFEEEAFSAASQDASPEQSSIESQKMQRAAQVLSRLSPRDREILRRFYLEEQSQEEICAAMNLSLTQLRLLKSRAKAKFGDVGRTFERRWVRCVDRRRLHTPPNRLANSVAAHVAFTNQQRMSAREVTGARI
jgi:RNA polymerase sigma factor (sigma-70 family)